MIRRILRRMRSTPSPHIRQISDMTRAELTAWAAKHGKTLVPAAELDALCAAAAANLDREYKVICGHD